LGTDLYRGRISIEDRFGRKRAQTLKKSTCRVSELPKFDAICHHEVSSSNSLWDKMAQNLEKLTCRVSELRKFHAFCHHEVSSSKSLWDKKGSNFAEIDLSSFRIVNV
jgi:hypothetical protein